MFEEVSGEDFTKGIRCNTSVNISHWIGSIQEPNGKGRGKGS